MKNIYHQTRFLVLALIVTGLLTISCSEPKNNDAKYYRLVFAYQDRIADAAAIIAVEKNFFQQRGLELEPYIFSSGPACAEALVYGKAQMATMGDATAINLVASSKGAFKIICTHGGGENRHRIIVSEKSKIQTPGDLQGKRIAVKKGTSTHGGLMQFAEKHSLALNEHIIDMVPSLQLTALASGEVDAIVASEPTPSIAESKGYGRQLAILGGLNNSYPILTVVNEKFVEQNPEIVKKAILALADAIKFIRDNPTESAKIISKKIELEADVILNAMKHHDYRLHLSDVTKESLERTAQFLTRIHQIENKPDLNGIFDDSYLAGEK